MCTQFQPRETICEFVDLYVLGSGSAEERSGFEVHLAECARCQLRVFSIADTLGNFAFRRPRLAARKALLEKVLADKQKHPSIVFEAPGVLAKRAEEIEWVPAGPPGVYAKTLFADETRGYHTSIVKLDPGTKYPAHRHAGIEEVFVLKGDLHFDFGVIVAGDYCRAEPETVHSHSHTENGCELLVTASTRDEFLPA